MKKAMLLTAAAVLLLVSVPGRADTESPALAKYRTRVDVAVKKGLAFLAARLGGTSDDAFANEIKRTNAVPGLAGMAFLSVGHTPGRGPYGDVVNRCIDYILATPFKVRYVPGGATEGYLVRANPYGRMYSHAIATLFLSEVSGMVDPERQKKIDAVLPKALKIILDAQAVQKEAQYAGGWRYLRTSNTSDLSISGWNLMALRSARLNGAPVPAEAIKKAIGYVNRCHNSAKGGFDYQPGEGKASPPMSAVGLLCRELSGHHNDAINRRCGDYLLAQAEGGALFTHPSYRAYTIYYASNAMFQLGGTYWEQFAPQLYKHLLSWQGTDGSVVLGHYGKVYSTSMYTLALTVTYRQLPIYQR